MFKNNLHVFKIDIMYLRLPLDPIYLYKDYKITTVYCDYEVWDRKMNVSNSC